MIRFWWLSWRCCNGDSCLLRLSDSESLKNMMNDKSNNEINAILTMQCNTILYTVCMTCGTPPGTWVSGANVSTRVLPIQKYENNTLNDLFGLSRPIWTFTKINKSHWAHYWVDKPASLRTWQKFNGQFRICHNFIHAWRVCEKIVCRWGDYSLYLIFTNCAWVVRFNEHFPLFHFIK